MRRAQGAKCPAETTIEVIGGRWKVPVVWHLFAGTKRFSELRRCLPGCTPKMLTQQLRELEADGIVARKVYAQVPPKVEYSLTQMGRSLEPLLHIMSEWGHGHRAALVKALRQAAGSAAADPADSAQPFGLAVAREGGAPCGRGRRC